MSLKRQLATALQAAIPSPVVACLAVGLGVGIAGTNAYIDWRHGEKIDGYGHARLYADMCYESMDSLGLIDPKNNPPVAYRAIYDPKARWIRNWQ